MIGGENFHNSPIFCEVVNGKWKFFSQNFLEYLHNFFDANSKIKNITSFISEFESKHLFALNNLKLPKKDVTGENSIDYIERLGI